MKATANNTLRNRAVSVSRGHFKVARTLKDKLDRMDGSNPAYPGLVRTLGAMAREAAYLEQALTLGRLPRSGRK